MGILQALLGLITKSAGKILNAIFGWAVHALFGTTTPRDETLLSGLVGAAAAWPILAVGVAAPRVATLVLTLVPIPKAVPAWSIRLVWLALAFAVPMALGLALAARRPAHAPAESRALRLLRGFPLTLGLALAFLVMFVSVPLMRLWALARRQQSVDIPLVTDVESYHEVASRIVQTLNRHGFGLEAAEPSWWVKAPMRILGWFGGAAFSGFVPQKIEHYVSHDGLELSFYTSGLLLRGRRGVSKAHGLIEETAVHSRGLETFSAGAQDIERQVRRLWRIYDEEPQAHEGSARLLGRLDELALELSRLEVDYEEWQVLYRQLLQAERAIRGRKDLMDGVLTSTASKASKATKEGTTMSTHDKTTVPSSANAGVAAGIEPRPPRRSDPEALPTSELVKEIMSHVEKLARTQFDLVKAELRADLSKERSMVTGLGIGAIGALLGLFLLFVTAIFGLAALMPAWQAGLIVSGTVLIGAGVAGTIGWKKRIKKPLAHTRRQLEEDVKWTKERMA